MCPLHNPFGKKKIDNKPDDTTVSETGTNIRTSEQVVTVVINNEKENEKHEEKNSMLILSLKNKSPSVRMEAAIELGKIGDKISVEPLVQTLYDEDETVLISAADALSIIGDSKAIEPMFQLVMKMRYDSEAHARQDRNLPVEWYIKTRSYETQVQVIKALLKLGDTRAIEPLIWILQHSDARTESIKVLVEFGALAVEPLILELTKDSPYFCKERVAIALGEIGDARALEPLLELEKNTAREPSTLRWPINDLNRAAKNAIWNINSRTHR